MRSCGASGGETPARRACVLGFEHADAPVVADYETAAKGRYQDADSPRRQDGGRGRDHRGRGHWRCISRVRVVCCHFADLKARRPTFRAAHRFACETC